MALASSTHTKDPKRVGHRVIVLLLGNLHTRRDNIPFVLLWLFVPVPVVVVVVV